MGVYPLHQTWWTSTRKLKKGDYNNNISWTDKLQLSIKNRNHPFQPDLCYIELGNPSELLQSKMDYVFDYIFNNVNLFTYNKWKCRIRLRICFVAGLCIRMVLTATGSVGSRLDHFSQLTSVPQTIPPQPPYLPDSFANIELFTFNKTV